MRIMSNRVQGHNLVEALQSLVREFGQAARDLHKGGRGEGQRETNEAELQ